MWLHDYLELHKNPIWLFLRADKTDSHKLVNHAHQGVEMLYIHEGQGEVIVDRRLHHVGAGSLMIFKPFQRHQVRMMTNESVPYIRSLMVFDPVYLEPFLKPFAQLRTFFHELSHGQQLASIVKVPHPQEMDAMLMRSKQRFPSPTIFRDTEQRVLFLIQFLEYCRPFIQYGKQESIEIEEPHLRDYAAMERILQWIELHFSEELDLEVLSKIAHLSPSYLSSLFHKKLGICLSDFIADRRIKQACFMLEATELAVKEIGSRTGYPNVSHFCKIFKMRMKQSPQAYRTESRKLLAVAGGIPAVLTESSVLSELPPS